MGTRFRFQAIIFTFSIFSLLGVGGCTPTRLTEGNAVDAKQEIAAVSKRINEEKRYRMSNEDLAVLEQNGLLNEKNKIALDTLSQK